MPKVTVKPADVTFMFEFSRAEVKALSNAINLDSENFDSTAEYRLADAIDDAVMDALRDNPA